MTKESSMPYSRADLLKLQLVPLKFDINSVKGYDKDVIQEIQTGLKDLAEIQRFEEKRFKIMPQIKVKIRSENEDENALVDKEISLWSSTLKNSSFGKIISQIKEENDERFLISSMLALHRNSYKSPAEVIDFFEEVSSESKNPEVAEWAKLFLAEMISTLPKRKNILNEPVSARDFDFIPNRPFDVTMPLIFSGVAYTKVAGIKNKIIISPLLFENLFGKAMACVRQDSFKTKLVIEKYVPDLHPDGSAHYEIFAFSGHTENITENAFVHNYWADISRPYYTSGKTEVVRDNAPVLRGVRFSFGRVAETTAPKRYWMNEGPLVETVRGAFFGYGQIGVNRLRKAKFALSSGLFQLTPKINPQTMKESNTIFYGVFYGKLSDHSKNGKLDMNTLPIHCTPDGKLDYLGDGSLEKDPIRPDDW
ncbi:MAG: hypothetical protein ACE5OZ_01170 [Candidatus Heimdallarchaeota archaeon]